MGGKFRDKIRVYSDCHAGGDDSPQANADKAKQVVDWLTAIKFDIDDLDSPYKYDRFNHTVNNAELDTMVAKVAAVREASARILMSRWTCTGATTPRRASASPRR